MTTLRRHDLDRMTHPVLCDLYRKLGGVDRRVSMWQKDEIATAILELQEIMTGAAAAGCAQCHRPGRSCGHGTILTMPRPCVGGCGDLTVVRAQCGAARTAECPGATTAAEPAPVPARKPPTVRAARTPRTSGRAADQRAMTDAAIAGMATRQPLRLLAALEGPFAPMRTYETARRSLPYWRPRLPGMLFAAHVVTGYNWSRASYTGPATVLDRSGAWIAGASSVEVAHGELVHAGDADFGGRPGYYQLGVHPWREQARLPHPLGYVRPGTDTVWVPAPTVALLADLVRQGRWPDVTVLDSYIGDGARLTEWTGHVNALRKHAITIYGRASDQYADVKINFGQSMSLMLGHLDDDRRRSWKCKAARPDWTHHIQAQASATLWRWADACRHVAPELAPIAVRNVDELVVPRAAVEILTTTPRPGGLKPLTIDPTGCTLGTFKIKDVES